VGDDALSHDWFVSFWPDDPDAGEAAWHDHSEGRYAELREVTPQRIRRLHELIEQAEAGIELLRRDRFDPIGRGLLGEALDGSVGVSGLDALLLPASEAPDPDGPSLRESCIDAPRRELLTPVAPALPVRTDRLVLRPFAPGDEDAFAGGWACEEWTSLLLTGTMNRAEVTDWVRRNADPTADATFLRLVVEHDGTVVGDSMLVLQGVGLSEAEIGWTVLPDHVGNGYATEAARAVLRLAFEHYGLRRVVANLDARNERSAALCERLGMRRESHKLADFWSKGQWTDSYEYALLADEWRAGAR
jgi:RimJ/RimL family protein N-acetyltransferase